MLAFSLVCLGGYLVLSWADFKSVIAPRTRAQPKPRTPGDRRCPFCHVSLDGETFVSCEICATEHHGECWNSHGRCSVFGCAGLTLAVPLVVAPATPAPAVKDPVIVGGAA